MALNKFEDFEHNLEEENKSERATDFESGMTELLGAKMTQGLQFNGPFYAYQKDDGSDTLFINRGTGTPWVEVKIIGLFDGE